MGTMAALAMALNHPANVRRLVMIDGYFYPEFRLDALMTAPVALPVLGDVMRHTVTALGGSAMVGSLVKTLFASQRCTARVLFEPVSRDDAAAGADTRPRRGRCFHNVSCKSHFRTP